MPNGRQINAYLALLLAVVCGIVAMVPMYVWGIPQGADLDNHFRFAMPFFDELASGNFSPGWLAESNMGFGDARFRFYPPFIYYVLAAARYVTGEWYIATMAVFSLFSVTGTIGAYFWTKQNLTRNIAVASAAIFAILPYHFAQFYQASLLAEFAALSLLPVAFMFVGRISVSKRFSPLDIAGLGVSFGLIVITHLPTMIIGSLSLGVFALLSTDWKRSKRTLAFAAIGIAFGLLLSSFFWVEMLTELPWIQAGHKVTSAYYDYRNNFLFSPFSATNLNNWFGSFVAAMTVGLLLPSVFVLKAIFFGKQKITTEHTESTERSGAETLRPAVIIAIIAFLMTTDLSRPVWWVVPRLADIQFPFRWLSVASVAICPVAAYSLYIFWERVREKKVSPLHVVVVLIAAAAAIYSIKELAIDSTFLDRTAFTERIESVRRGPSFPDWLPVGAAELKDLKPMDGPIDPNGREVISTNIQTHHRRFTLTAGQPTEVRIRTYYYPLWQATVTTANSTTKAQTKPAEDGTLLVTVLAESCEVSVDFVK